MKSINEKMKKLGENRSAIRDLFEYGNKRKNEIGADKVYDFSIGNPSIPCPKIVHDKIKELLDNNDPVFLHGYTSASGDFSVRKSIANYLQEAYAATIDPNLIYLTCGAAAALTISFNALINSGDEVIVFAPFFPEYRVFVEKAGGKLVISKTNKSFLIDFDDLEQKINENTKIIVINSPNNPTGVIYKEELIIKLAKYLENKEKEYGHPIYLISDEPYRDLIYTNTKYPYITNYYKDSIVCYSFSKVISLPGERIGYVTVNKEMDNAKEVYSAICGSGRSLGFVCLTSLFQYLIPSIQGITSDLNCYKENCDLLYKILTDIGYDVIYPEGAFYLFVKALEDDAKKFSNNALKFDLLLVPSDSFGTEGYVRIAYCVSKKQIENAKEAFKKLYDLYK